MRRRPLPVLPWGAMLRASVLCLLVPFLCAAAPAGPTIVHSEAVSVKRDLKAKRQDLRSVQRRLEREKRMRQATERREKSVLNRLEAADRQLEKLERERKANENDLANTRQRIELLERMRGEAGEVLKERRASLVRRIKAIQRARMSDPLLSTALGLHRAAESSRSARFSLLLGRSNQRLIEQVEAERRRLSETTEHLTGEKTRRERILSALERQKRRATDERGSRERLLTSIRGEKAVRESAIQDLSTASRQLSLKVDELMRQQTEAERREAEARRAEILRRKEVAARAASLAAVQKPAVDEGMVEGKLAPPLVGGAGLGRGLAWPVTGVVTRSFGKTKSREFNTTLESAGIQIRAARGTPIKAVASGRVRYADWFQGYGKLVILDHGRGYYSLYAQASDLFVAPGDQVKTGQPIATVGDTGSLVGDSLYFEVRKDGLPQNPLLFLKKKKG